VSICRRLIGGKNVLAQTTVSQKVCRVRLFVTGKLPFAKISQMQNEKNFLRISCTRSTRFGAGFQTSRSDLLNL
jgi:hypothetical protein